METLDSGGKASSTEKIPRIRGTKEERKGILDKDTIVHMGIVRLPCSPTHLDNDRVTLLVKIPTGMISSLTAELAAKMWRETRVLIGLVIERLKILLRNKQS